MDASELGEPGAPVPSGSASCYRGHSGLVWETPGIKRVGGRSSMAFRSGFAVEGDIGVEKYARIAARLAAAMLSFGVGTRVFVALEPMDMRRSFNGLSAWVQNKLGADLFTGALFVFTNREKNRLKILFWDKSGLWVCAKRLERSRFTWPTGEGLSCSLRSEELMALIGGWELHEKKGWYRR